ncbi:MAG TPA: formimidoylglutamate deiminase [Burkholderiales bacterium]|nr:formimidoylglutamate deiminase [Burkholderiales bacterium]
MSAFFAGLALLPSGWAKNVRLEVDAGGVLSAVSPDASAAGAARLAGSVLPGICDLHSHAFQRAMAGLTERRSATADSFWTWRDVMYKFAARLAPEDLEAIAAQLYIELLKGGYTSVCEFHYIHNGSDGRPFANRAEMSERLVRAAARVGIGLTLLPVLYQTANFGGVPPHEGQRRFVTTVDEFLGLVGALRDSGAGDPNVRIGIAPHSLRAVPPEALRDAIRGMDATDAAAPIHIHIAEQTKEVDDCVAWSGRRPVEWLLANHSVSSRWCLVHATHLTEDETFALARSGAVAGLCPTTEANLGDGFFPLPAFLAGRGAFGVGSDSNVSTSSVEELRWLEYGQRLLHRRRAVAASPAMASPGLVLYQGAVAGGATASGRPIAGLAPGQRADFLVIDADTPFLCGRGPDELADAIVFGGNANPIRDVFVGGEQVIEQGRHARQEAAQAAYRAAAERLAASL